MSAFVSGPDPRRNTRGRPPSSASLSQLIRKSFARDASAIIDRVRADALAGDPQAIQAACVLIASSIRGAANE